MIDSSFYGRESIHYCRSGVSAPASQQKECGWVDVKATITGKELQVLVVQYYKDNFVLLPVKMSRRCVTEFFFSFLFFAYSDLKRLVFCFCF